jgi:hypothetical protein
MKIGIDHIRHEQPVIMPDHGIGAVTVPDDESTDHQDIKNDQENNE